MIFTHTPDEMGPTTIQRNNLSDSRDQLYKKSVGIIYVIRNPAINSMSYGTISRIVLKSCVLTSFQIHTINCTMVQLISSEMRAILDNYCIDTITVVIQS